VASRRYYCYYYCYYYYYYYYSLLRLVVVAVVVSLLVPWPMRRPPRFVSRVPLGNTPWLLLALLVASLTPRHHHPPQLPIALVGCLLVVLPLSQSASLVDVRVFYWLPVSVAMTPMPRYAIPSGRTTRTR
jgi:hypothetical protein